jgi:hypothetical protein
VGGRAENGRVAVTHGYADDGIPRLHERQVRGERGAGQAVEDGDVVARRGAAQMLQRERLQPIPVERGGDLVVGPAQILRLHRQRVVEAGEDVDRLGASLADDRPRLLQLREVVRGGREDLAARI